MYESDGSTEEEESEEEFEEESEEEFEEESEEEFEEESEDEPEQEPEQEPKQDATSEADERQMRELCGCAACASRCPKCNFPWDIPTDEYKAWRADQWRDEAFRSPYWMASYRDFWKQKVANWIDSVDRAYEEIPSDLCNVFDLWAASQPVCSACHDESGERVFRGPPCLHKRQRCE